MKPSSQHLSTMIGRRFVPLHLSLETDDSVLARHV